MPLFTIAIVTLNDAPALAATLRSVAQQTFADYQCIVQDGLSSDYTEEIVHGFGDIIDDYRSENDNGIYDAMNRAVRLVKGEYVLFLNAQDVLATQKTLLTLSQMLRPADDVAYGKVISAETGKLYDHKPRNMYWTGMTFDHQAAVVRADLLREFPFDDTLRISGDLDFFSRIRLAGYHFRELDVDIALKPFEGGASANWLKRFRERHSVLLKHFGTKHPVSSTLQGELVEHIARKAACDPLWLERSYPEMEALLAFGEKIIEQS